MNRSEFRFDLPTGRIAQEPRKRGSSRLMVVHPGEGVPRIDHQSFAEFPAQLRSGDVLVINDTRVIPARLTAAPVGSMQRGVEVLLGHHREGLVWDCLCKPGRRLRKGTELLFSPGLRGRVLEKNDDGSVAIEFTTGEDEHEESFWREVERIGAAPLPPYIRRDEPQSSDIEAYQTVYAQQRGAVAAPTAGLHFDDSILERIRARGVELIRVTLHVGLGTFAPVKVDDLDEHVMHEERYEISPPAAEALNRALDRRTRIVAVGTTSVRALESAAAAGGGRIVAGRASTSLFIRPGFKFHVVDALLTNFHLPESTLIVLVSAFAGINTIRTSYQAAIEQGYLFFSYGDCMFLANRGGS